MIGAGGIGWRLPRLGAAAMSDDPKITQIGQRLRNAPASRKTAGGGYLPDDCPITPLGKNGLMLHLLDSAQSYVQIECRALSKNTIAGLFGRMSPYLLTQRAWAKAFDEKTQKPKSWAPDKVAEAIMQACDEEGPFAGPECLRGNGAWLGQDNALLVHLGNVILNGKVTERPGKRDQHIYVRRPARTPPARERQPAGPDGPAAELERLLRCWNWRRPELDPRLVVGAVCAAWLCGALEARPQVWFTGERGCGKSTLVKRLLAQLLHEGESCIVTDDPTPAGIRARMQQDAIALFYDEAEPSEDNTKLNSVIDLARSAFTGGSSLRSTENHGTVMHAIRFSGFYSSILRPSFKTADLSRIAPIQLKKNPAGRAPRLARDELWLLGQRLHKRMIDNWAEFQERLEAWREAVVAAGLDNRGADLYATLLAAADVALHDAPPDSDTLAEIAGQVAEATRADRAEEEPEWSRCLGHLCTMQAPQWRGGRLTDIGGLIAQAAGRMVMRDEEGQLRRPTAQEMADAAGGLAALGLRVVPMRDQQGRPIRDPDTGDVVGHLAIANAHATLASLFQRTPWAARAGTAGAWRTALEEAPDAMPHREMRFGAKTSRCLLVPLHVVLGQAEEETGT
jgi:energy-coupling factor transporter ATP-binding protein EcfA2